ncbi:MAG: 6-hydroxymethylpterin diphosphokinase MptE-like protein [Opitutales bacterium]
MIQDRIEAKLDFLKSIPSWLALKNKHIGKRGFVIGNGPSLNAGQLDLLKDEITIASNKIYLVFNETEWRPKYYTISDNLVWQKVGNIVGSYFDKVYTSNSNRGNPEGVKKVVWRNRGKVLEPRNGFFSRSPILGLFGGSTVTFDNMQLAVFMGLNPIYLIGCDHFYDEAKNAEELKPIRHENKSNHFHKDYRKPGELVNPAPIAQMDLAYGAAADFATKNKWMIKNLTPGGFLEAFPRDSLETIL